MKPKEYQLVVYGGEVGLVIATGRNHPDCLKVQDEAKLLFDVFPDGKYDCPHWYPCDEIFPATQQDITRFKREHSMFWFGCQMLRRGNHSDIFGKQNEIVSWVLKNAFPLWKEIRHQAEQEARAEFREQRQKEHVKSQTKLRNTLIDECMQLQDRLKKMQKSIEDTLA